MKTKITVLLAIFSIFITTSCLNLELETSISGMGNESGELEIDEHFEKFNQIDSVELSSIEPMNNEVFSLNTIISTDPDNTLLKGSGGSYQNNNFHAWIIIKLKVCNKTRRPLYFFLPEGLLFKVSDETYQHGILMSDEFIWILPRQCRTVYLSLYCVNKGKHGSSEDIDYTPIGTTASKRMKDLISRLTNKELNISKYIMDDNLAEYEKITDNIQNIIWGLTNDETLLSDDDIKYINSLPEKED